MSELHVLDEVSRSLGKIESTLVSMDKTLVDIKEEAKDKEKRLRSLENSRAKGRGMFALAAAALSYLGYDSGVLNKWF